MSYHCGIGPGMGRIGMTPREPAIKCDGCGAEHIIKPRGVGSVPPTWFLDNKPPPGWRTLRMHDGSKRWDLCQECWKRPTA